MKGLEYRLTSKTKMVLGNEYKGPNWVSFLCHFSTVQAAGCKCGIVG
ncbi:hypothetical protein Lalb_Chr08g0233751 [Lupinus albus]|uniref:Uncharacterized protein n=1 Tax=Lupinus albus TaxID=3870 RepID=A0A6A4Q2U6_LUPAL|nr:hypothetical protein Lalb_Chr08g0233751 [Lupinus albus]